MFNIKKLNQSEETKAVSNGEIKFHLSSLSDDTKHQLTSIAKNILDNIKQAE